MSDTIEKLYSTTEAANLLGVGSDVVRQYIRLGKLEANRRGGRFVLTAAQIKSYMQGEPYKPKK